jgi:hypothetical protein
MHLLAEGSDTMDSSQLSTLLGIRRNSDSETRLGYSAHTIFHGPKHRLPNAGSEKLHKNDFLGEASQSSFDTHVFEGEGFEGALIEKGEELHLHLRSTGSYISNENHWTSLVKNVERSLGFTHGFHPWPAYRETRLNHRLGERWISRHLGLRQTALSPLSKAMWAHNRGSSDDPLVRIIPTIATGFAKLPDSLQNGLETMLWQFRSMELSDLPGTTKLLMICAILDGTMKLLAGASDPSSKPKTNKVWNDGCAAAGLSWENWGKELFELYGKHRQHLAHGWLWLPVANNLQDYFVNPSLVVGQC